MNIDQTTKKILNHLYFFKMNLESIDSINIYNTFSENFGRKYCNINIDVNLKDNLDENLNKKYNETLLEFFGNYVNEIDFHYSYYLSYDDDIEEKFHYEYISHFISNFLVDTKIKVVVENYISLAQLREEKLEQYNNYQTNLDLLKESLKLVKIEPGLFLATKNYSADNMKLSIIKDVVVGKENKILSITISEVLKNLAISPIQKDLYISIDNFYLIFKYIPKCKDKIELIEMISNNTEFEGVIWRRPLEAV